MDGKQNQKDASRNTRPKITPETLTIDLASAKGNKTNFGLVYALPRSRTKQSLQLLDEGPWQLMKSLASERRLQQAG
ncbi:hypothetical protein LOC71_13790 [Rhodopirellula sp. JC740]|uniref:Uncharacterized protein n=1 Tax=Rhodopirellula halodulae TaxID=2894198 RepID=A0ABS8NIH0_9BACT|nr:hypothetical protein [Rhodopirellula sp. JC740]MCC9643352.1 hypothetical protein [Rhodopirellula sp. JC740]